MPDELWVLEQTSKSEAKLTTVSSVLVEKSLRDIFCGYCRTRLQGEGGHLGELSVIDGNSWENVWKKSNGNSVSVIIGSMLGGGMENNKSRKTGVLGLLPRKGQLKEEWLPERLESRSRWVHGPHEPPAKNWFRVGFWHWLSLLLH